MSYVAAPMDRSLSVVPAPTVTIRAHSQLCYSVIKGVSVGGLWWGLRLTLNVFLYTFCFVFWHRVSHGSCSSPVWLHWLTSALQEVASPPFPVPELE